MKKTIELFALAGICTVTACAHAPTKAGERADIVVDAEKTLRRMKDKDPGLRRLIENADAYIVFPEVGNAGFLVGGGSGKGVLYEHGIRTGFATVEHMGAGALIGGQRYSELVIVKNRDVLDRVRSGHFDFGLTASAVVLGNGAAANATFSRGVAVVIEPLRGTMLDASLNGQRIHVTM